MSESYGDELVGVVHHGDEHVEQNHEGDHVIRPKHGGSHKLCKLVTSLDVSDVQVHQAEYGPEERLQRLKQPESRGGRELMVSQTHKKLKVSQKKPKLYIVIHVLNVLKMTFETVTASSSPSTFTLRFILFYFSHCHPIVHKEYQ